MWNGSIWGVGRKGNNSLKGKEVLRKGCEQQHDASCSSQCFICIPWTSLQVLKWPRNLSTANIYNHVILMQFECISDGFQPPTKLYLCPRLVDPFADNPISCGPSPAQYPAGRSGRKTTGHCLSSGREWPSNRASLCAESSPGFSCS